uniref:AB hydrolase-1 domain-containing protein n=1 Tax=Chenopodium quinoa TaxID=63459 RepID=A0A803MXX8_CHEQI
MSCLRRLRHQLLATHVLCIVYSYLDELFEKTASSTSCYWSRREQEKINDNIEQDEVSQTLYKRPNLFRDMGLFNSRRMRLQRSSSKFIANRWSDCGCESCVAWINSGDDLRLHVVVHEPELIEKSVIFPYRLNSFHLVAHSMGSIIALALAAKYPQHVKSITLIAPPYFPSDNKQDASLYTLGKVAEKRLWPPLLFGSSFMSWYEHLGRTVCFILCRNHKIWEFLLRLITWRRDLHFTIMDLTRHTHHSAWHTMHNVICGGSKYIEEYLSILRDAKVKFTIIQGDEDQVVPIECSSNIKMKVPEADVRIIPKTNHSTILLRHTKEFTRDLESIWISCR